MPDFVSSHPFTLQILMDQDIYLIPEPQITEIKIPKIESNEAVVTTHSKPPIELIDMTILKYFGNPQSKVLLMVSDSHFPVCADSERDLFKNICTAMNWTAKDYMIINTAQNPTFTAETWLKTLQPTIVILFDIPIPQFDMNILLNEIIVQNDTKIIKTQSLASLNQNRTHKISFWNELKKLK